MNNKTIIHLCEKIIRDVIDQKIKRIKNKPFLEEAKKLFKYENFSDWRALCSLLDVLNYTELAKDNFEKYDLTGPTKIIDNGEIFLRLYGVLNAVYIQKNAIFSLVEIVKLDNKRDIIKKFDNLDLIELRHKVAAHPVDYEGGEGERIPHQISLEGLESGFIRVLDSKNYFSNYDIKKLFHSFNRVADETIIDATEKFIKTVLKNDELNLKKYADRLRLVKDQRDGDKIWYAQNVIISYKKPKTQNV